MITKVWNALFLHGFSGDAGLVVNTACEELCPPGILILKAFESSVEKRNSLISSACPLGGSFDRKQMCNDCLICASWQPLSQLLYYSKTKLQGIFEQQVVQKPFIGDFSPFGVVDQHT